MRKNIFFLICMVFTRLLLSQNTCDEAIEIAEQHYQSGKFADALISVESCAEKGAIKLENAVLFRMAALSSFRLDQAEKADIYARKLLKSYPEYRQFPMNDPKDFSKFLETYSIQVAWQAGIRAGLLVSIPEIIKQYTVSEQTNSYQAGLQYGAGFQLTRRLNNTLSLRFEPGFARLQYIRKSADVMGVSQEYSEIQNYQDLPLNLLLARNLKNTGIYSITGIQSGVLSGAYGLIESRDPQTEKRIVDSYDVIGQRRKILWALNLGLGADIPAGKGRLGFSALWQHSLRNMVLTDKRYENMAQIISSKYVENDFKLHALRIQLYYQIPVAYQVSRNLSN